MEKLKSIFLLEDSESWFYIILFFLPFLAVSPWQPALFLPVPSGFLYSLLVVLAFISLMKERKKRGEPLSRWHPLFSVLLIFLYVSILSLVFNWDLIRLHPAIKNAVGFKSPYVYNIFLVVYLAFNLLTLWLAFSIVDSRTKLKKAFQIFIISSVLGCIYGLIVHFGGLFGIFKDPIITRWLVQRLHGTASEAQVFGNFLLSCLPFAFVMFLVRKDIFKRDVFSVFLFLLSLTMFLTLSLGAWIGFAAGVGLAIVFCVNYIKFERVLGAFLILLLILGIAFIIDHYMDPDYFQAIQMTLLKHTVEPVKLDTVNPPSGVDRSWLWSGALKMFWQHPIIGVGTGNFGFLYNYYRPEGTAAKHFLAKAHNAYLEILAETGVIGFAVFSIFIATVLIRLGMTFYLSREEDERLFVAAISASLIGLLVHGLAFGILVHNYTWIMLGLSIAATEIFKVKS